MPRQIDYRSTSPHSADEVYATIVDPDYLRARLKQIGGPGAALLEHTADVEGARYRLRHGVDAKNMPSMVRHVMPGDHITIERTEQWTRQDSGNYLGDVQVAMPGTPAFAAGGMRLRDLPDGGSELNVKADVTVSLPLIGGKIESMVAGQLQNLLAEETAFTQQWLAGAP
jgi:hypothetical protein